MTHGAGAWAATNSGPEPVVEAVGPTGYRVRVPLPEPRIARGVVWGHDLAEIQIPGFDLEPSADAPPLPTRTIFLRVPWGVRASATITPRISRSLGAVRPAPFAYLLTDPAVRGRRGVEEIGAALAGPAYRGRSGRGEAPYAAAPREMAASAERFLAVPIRPVRWDPTTGEATYFAEAVIEVTWDRAVHPEAVRPLPARGSVERDLAPATAVGPTYAPGTRAARASLAPLFQARRAPGLGQAGIGPFRVDPSRAWVRFALIRSGLYQVGPADLAAAGVAVGSIDPATFRIFRATPGDIPEGVDVDLGPDSLRECAIEVTGAADGVFDPADRIFFYATGSTGFAYDLKLGGGVEYQEGQHTDEETLWLTWGAPPTPGSPRRISTRAAAPVTGGATLYQAVTHRVHFEQNRLANFNLVRPPLRWEFWFDRLFSEGSRVPFVFQLPGALPGGAADFRVRMWGRGNSLGAMLPDHVVRIYWHRVLADTAGWDLLEPQDLAASGLAVSARDTMEIEVPKLIEPGPPGPLKERLDESYLAWLEISYPRRLAATNDTLQFAAPDSVGAARVQYAIEAVGDTATAWLLDRTDPESPVRLTGGVWSGTAPSFTLTVEDSAGAGYRPRYSLLSTARAVRPPSITLHASLSGPHVVSDLLDPGNGADYLIVAPPAFLAAAESLAAYRSQGLSGITAPRVRIATTDRIFAQFGAGRPSPTAIRNWIVYASRYWISPPPSYLCLLGDATLDPKNYLGIGAPDLVPTYSNYFDGSTLSQFTSDDFYVLLDGPTDQLVDLVVGRLPAGNAAEAMGLAAGKLRAYEGATAFDSWRTRALLTADDQFQRNEPDDLKNAHVEQMERHDGVHLPYPIERAKVYLNDFAFADTTRQSKPAARDEFLAQVNRGAWITAYVGHGNDDVLADEQVFRSSDLSRLTNADRPSIFGYFSCTVGKFDKPSGEALGELALTFPTGGAVVSLAASDLVFGGKSTALSDSFIDELFPLSPRVDTLRTAGLAFARAKNTNVNTTARKYGFLGDPALRPPLPRGRGVWEKGVLDSVLRGDVVLIRGHALMPDSSSDTVSTGTADLLIQGPPIVRTQTTPIDGGRQTYTMPGPTLYRGQVALAGGSFEARFVVPVDGRISGRGGKLRALLSSAGGQGVGLAVDSIRIAVGPSARVDATPPTIQRLIPPGAGTDSTFRPGERVTFVIEDTSGIDLTRLDNAHTIFVIVDDRGTPFELTSQFAYDPGSFTRGRVDFVVPPVADGAHRVEVHASDTFRNIGVETFVIEVTNSVAAGTALLLDQVFNYPNPFPRETYLHARLNQPARLRIQILTVAGRRVREIQLDGKAGENYIPWDGRDSVGENVAIGVYLFKVTAESPTGIRVSAIGRALRTQ